MSTRTPSLKNGAKLIRQYLAEKSISITHVQALEALSRAYGYNNYQSAAAGQSQEVHAGPADATPDDQDQDPLVIVLTDEVPSYMINENLTLGRPVDLFANIERAIKLSNTPEGWGTKAGNMLRAILPVTNQDKEITLAALDRILSLDFFKQAYLTGYDLYEQQGRWPANCRYLRYYLEEELPAFNVEYLIRAHKNPADEATIQSRSFRQDSAAVEQHGYRVHVARNALLELFQRDEYYHPKDQGKDWVNAPRWGGRALSDQK